MADLISGTDLDHFQAGSESSLISWYSKAVQTYCGIDFTQTTYTHDIDGGEEFLFTTQLPVISITSITDLYDNSTVLDTSEYGFYANGLIYKKPQYTLNTQRWPSGKERFRVVYVAGYATIPDDVKLAVSMLVNSTISTKDPSLGSETIGDYSYAKKLTSDQWPTEVKGLLSKYKMVWL